MRRTLLLLTLLASCAVGFGYGSTAALGPATTEPTSPTSQLGYVEPSEPVAYDSARYTLPVDGEVAP